MPHSRPPPDRVEQAASRCRAGGSFPIQSPQASWIKPASHQSCCELQWTLRQKKYLSGSFISLYHLQTGNNSNMYIMASPEQYPNIRKGYIIRRVTMHIPQDWRPSPWRLSYPIFPGVKTWHVVCGHLYTSYRNPYGWYVYMYTHTHIYIIIYIYPSLALPYISLSLSESLSLSLWVSLSLSLYLPISL